MIKVRRHMAVLFFLATMFSMIVLKPLDAAVFNPETFMLQNGMQVVIVENHRVPVVTHMVWYRVGAADEGPGETGVAHFLEHLMFKGTPSHPNGEFSTIVARNGGQENAFTSYDYTAYYQTVAKDRLELVMAMEADRMTNLILSDDDINTERMVVLEERRSRTDNNPSALLSEQINAALYLNHPYRRPIIGWEHEIRDLNRDSIMEFYQRWYAPNNAILVVAGDITADELRPLAEKYYGPIQRADTPERMRPKEPPQRAAREVTYRDARVRQPSWHRSFLAPSYNSGETQHAYALEILSDILGGSTGRLYRELVIDNKIALNAGAYYSPDNLGPGRFVVYAIPAPGVEMAALESAVEGVIGEFLSDGVTDEEVARSINTMQASAIYARDSLSGGARTLGAALASGQTIDDVESWPDRVSVVSPTDVNAAAKHVFSVTHSVTGLLLPEEN